VLRGVIAPLKRREIFGLLRANVRRGCEVARSPLVTRYSDDTRVLVRMEQVLQSGTPSVPAWHIAR